MEVLRKRDEKIMRRVYKSRRGVSQTERRTKLMTSHDTDHPRQIIFTHSPPRDPWCIASFVHTVQRIPAKGHADVGPVATYSRARNVLLEDRSTKCGILE
jgi:hypothetical protein